MCVKELSYGWALEIADKCSHITTYSEFFNYLVLLNNMNVFKGNNLIIFLNFYELYIKYTSKLIHLIEEEKNNEK